MVKCPKCHSVNSVDDQFCNECQFNLTYELLERPSCPVCLSMYEKGALFCEKDGSRLIAGEKLTSSCEVCGKTYSEEVKFCPEDGGKIRLSSGDHHTAVQLQYQQIHQAKASLGKRFAAFFLDGLIALGLSLPSLLFFLAALYKLDYREYDFAALLFLFAVLFYFIPLMYSLFKDGLGQGQSWGKRAFDLQILQEESLEVCSYKKSFARNGIMALLQFIPFVGVFIEPIVLISSDEKKRLGDKLAKTIVIDKTLRIG